MKKLTLITIMSFVYLTLCTTTAFSGEMDHSSHGSANSKKTGDMIHKSTVEGYKLMYHLIDMSEQVKNMPEMKGTNHLMVFINNSRDSRIGDAKVGYFVTGPDKSEQKVMTMAMSGGFGADVKFKDKGTYLITTKALVGGKKLVDHFTYKIE